MATAVRLRKSLDFFRLTGQPEVVRRAPRKVKKERKGDKA